MKKLLRTSLAALAAAVMLPTLALAQTHAAHEHGKVAVDIAVEREQLTVAIDTPLDNLLGFERAPRSATEKQAAAAAVAKLRAADGWLRIDPQAGCQLKDVTLASAALGLGGAAAEGEHADLEGSVTYRCTDATRAAWIDVGLADAFQRVKSLQVQVAGPKGQAKQTLSGKNRRVVLAK